MCDFKPGDEVVCVDASPSVGEHSLIEGATYVIGDTSDRWAEPSVWVGCLNEWGGRHWHYASRFRKVQRRDLTAWLATENTVEGPVRAPAKETV